MKLKVPLYSQRDPRWKDVLLGYNTSSLYTISGWGCLITSFAMYLTAIGKNKTPLDVNNDLKANGGFTQGSGNLIWSKIASVYGIVNEYQSPYYNGPVTDFGINKIKSSLDEGKPCICHVDMDMNDADDDQHWIVLTGYENDKIYANDPWTGTDIDLEVYGGAKRAILEFLVYNITVPKYENTPTSCESELVNCKVQVEKEIKNKNETYNELVEVKQERDGLKSQVQTYDGLMMQYSNLLGCEKEPTVMAGKISELVAQEDDFRKTTKQVQDLTSEKIKLEGEIQIVTNEKTILFKSLHELEENDKKVVEENKKLKLDIKMVSIFKITNKYYFCKKGE